MKIISLLCMFVVISAVGLSATIYVPDDYSTIQAAIDAAVNGDTIIVRPGTYEENIDFKGKAITVMSEQGDDVTVIDGNKAGSVVTCSSGEGPDSVLDGFTITNGYTTSYGGGMSNYESNPTVTNCTFTDNYAHLLVKYFGSGGGGMSNEYSNPTVTNCIFLENGANGGFGGGMYNGVSNPTVINCIFSLNSAESGGGMENAGGNPMVINCTFSENSAECGGGMCNESSNPTVTNCIFTGNLGTHVGGGMLNFDSNPMVTNCTFSGNSAESGGGIYSGFQCAPIITNTVLWNNDATKGPEICIYMDIFPSTVSISYSDVKGGQSSVYVASGCTLNWGPGMIDADPLFVDSANSDFHISFLSPCRGSGDNSAVTELYDFEGDPRIYQGTVDIGADEFYTHLYITGDQTPGGSIQGKFVGIPGTSPVRLFIGLGGVRPTPLPTIYGDLWLLPPRLSISLIQIPANGILAIPTTIPASPPAPYDIPMQGLVGLNSDSLTNLCVLEVR